MKTDGIRSRRIGFTAEKGAFNHFLSLKPCLVQLLSGYADQRIRYGRFGEEFARSTPTEKPKITVRCDQKIAVEIVWDGGRELISNL